MINGRMRRLGEERSVIRELFEYGNARAQQIGRENVFDFSLGNPNVPAPDCVRYEIENALQTVSSEQLHGYTSAPGDPMVRKKVAEYITDTFGTSMRADLVYMTCGAAASLTIALSAVCNADDEVIVLTPYFPEYRVFIESVGCLVKEVKTNGCFHIDFDAIKRAITDRTKAIIINSPNNPTGVVYCEEELRMLGELLRAQTHTIYLIADEPYRELVYDVQVPYPMTFYENTVVCYSFSKSLSLAGERIGYLAVSPQCRNAEEVFFAICGAGRSLGFVCAPSLFQRVCANCLGRSSDVAQYKENRDLLYNALTSFGFECVKPDGAFYLFVKSPEEDARAFSERAKSYEILLVPSDSFGVKGYVRISYCVAKKQIERALPFFKRLAQEYRLM